MTSKERHELELAKEKFLASKGTKQDIADLDKTANDYYRTAYTMTNFHITCGYFDNATVQRT